MKFFALAILRTSDLDIGEDALRAAVREVMWPHRDRTVVGDDDRDREFSDAEIQAGRWDYYLFETLEWLSHYGYAPRESDFRGEVRLARAGDLRPADFEREGGLGEPDVVTPSAWLEFDYSRAGSAAEAAAQVNSFGDRTAVLLFCHH